MWDKNFKGIIMEKITISLVSPCASIDKDILKKAHINLINYDYELDKDTIIRQGKPAFINGSKEERIKELIEHEESHKTDAIWCTRGGVGAIELIKDYKPAKKQSILIGFSDVTILHLHRFLYDKRVGLHAPVAHQACNELEFKILNSLLLKNSVSYPKLSLVNNFCKTNVFGNLIVMNLSSLQSMLGAFDINIFKGAILAIEDNNIKHYQFYRAMHQLKNAGIFKNITGLIIGHIDNQREECLETIKDLSNIDNFALFDWPYFGHQSPNLALIFGGLVNIIKITDNEYELTYK